MQHSAYTRDRQWMSTYRVAH